MARGRLAGAGFERTSSPLAHRKRLGIVGCALVIAATSIATADPQVPSPAPNELRRAVTAHFAAETASVRNAIAVVQKKLEDGDTVRGRRLLAAARLLRGHVPRDASPEEQLVAARRAAAAGLLLTRDAAERRLLLDELTELGSDAIRIAINALQAEVVSLPSRLSRPTSGSIARGFGAYVHKPTTARLSHRGIEFAVEPRAPVVAPTDGVVRFAGTLRGFDRAVIIDHGHFLSVLAKLGEALVPVGARVGEGDHVGRAADRHVYFEVRVKLGPGGLPIDPEPLLSRPKK